MHSVVKQNIQEVTKPELSEEPCSIDLFSHYVAIEDYEDSTDAEKIDEEIEAESSENSSDSEGTDFGEPIEVRDGLWARSRTIKLPNGTSRVDVERFDSYAPEALNIRTAPPDNYKTVAAASALGLGLGWTYLETQEQALQILLSGLMVVTTYAPLEALRLKIVKTGRWPTREGWAEIAATVKDLFPKSMTSVSGWLIGYSLATTLWPDLPWLRYFAVAMTDPISSTIANFINAAPSLLLKQQSWGQVFYDTLVMVTTAAFVAPMWLFIDEFSRSPNEQLRSVPHFLRGLFNTTLIYGGSTFIPNIFHMGISVAREGTCLFRRITAAIPEASTNSSSFLYNRSSSLNIQECEADESSPLNTGSAPVYAEFKSL